VNPRVLQRIDALIPEIEPDMIADRRDFHRFAEAGWTEFRTASRIARRLKKLGYDVSTGRSVCCDEARMGLPSPEDLETHWQRAHTEDGDPEFLESMRGGFTGVVGRLRNGVGPTLGLRFDIDALGVSESAESSHRPVSEGFASIHPGVMHACGHDGHAAIGLGLARLFSEMRNMISGTLVLVFQPAEEGVRGARSMVEAGVLDDVDLMIVYLLMSGAATGEIIPGMGGYAATRKLDVEILGAPAHAGGSPEAGRNALLAAATAVLNLHALPRHRDGFTRINVGQIHAGTGRNVIPDRARLVAEVRGETSALCDSMYERAIRVIEAAATMHGCDSTVRPMGAAGTAESSPELVSRVVSIAESLGESVLEPLTKIGGSEDFTEMMLRIQQQGGQAVNIGIGADRSGIRQGDADRSAILGAHTSVYDFDEQALRHAMRLLSLLAVDLLDDPSGTPSG